MSIFHIIIIIIIILIGISMPPAWNPLTLTHYPSLSAITHNVSYWGSANIGVSIGNSPLENVPYKFGIITPQHVLFVVFEWFV